ncbi:Sau3AI family type II restriction endonuclease [Pontibacillus litoralis]|uniref:Type II restriction endonuclease n=1 Tax=Pontibacillus litoralis JSM 072002 TaxID=1385512 RepID=A0A0A5G793_9BACI|nr:Sau3AI family type II restriction endonuclease [Pontibacillus litoralis]KGX87013.1 type II restriction endonuclease [Pontibacillus litoralis JSM 072002]
MSEGRVTYDITNAQSIEKHAKMLENKTFRESMDNIVIRESGNKGGLGQLIEENHFGYKLNSDSEPDFPEAGVELKVTPYKINTKKGNKVAKERLVLSIINYMTLPYEKFENSMFYKKNKLLLLIFYLYQPKEEIKDRLDYKITHAQLFEFPKKDLNIIKRDWEIIKEKVNNGLAHELSERDTNYLGACTKGANKNSLREQPHSNEPAMQRAYSLKASYMTAILNDYILAKKATFEDSVIDDERVLEEESLESYILKKFEPFKGFTIDKIKATLDIHANRKAKNFAQKIASKMLNLQTNNIEKSEEFIKANIKLKTIRVEKNGKIKEHMSFPTFKYKEIVQEEWETSTLRQMFLETKFLFFIYRFNENNELCFYDAMFWNIPFNDLEIEVKKVWEETVSRIMDDQADKLPGSKDNLVSHVRPHAQNKMDTYETPQGKQVVKKCFWLNNYYLEKQLGLNK